MKFAYDLALITNNTACRQKGLYWFKEYHLIPKIPVPDFCLHEPKSQYFKWLMQLIPYKKSFQMTFLQLFVSLFFPIRGKLFWYIGIYLSRHAC